MRYACKILLQEIIAINLNSCLFTFNVLYLLITEKTHPADAIYPLSLKTSTKQCYFREFGHNIIIQQVHVLGFPISDFDCQVIFH